MIGFLQAWPAYGRQYKSEAEITLAFLDGQDFSASRNGGPYFSIRDFSEPHMIDFSGVLLCQLGPDLEVMIHRMEMKRAN